MSKTSKSPRYTFFATSAKSMEDLLADELRRFNAENVRQTRAGVCFEGSLEIAFRACLWSRIASRILLPVTTFHAGTAEELYEGIRTIPWNEHLSVTTTFAVTVSSSQSHIGHTHFGALKVKDAIVDQFWERSGKRPLVSTVNPGLRINVYLHRNEATVSIDLSGESLHRREYRDRTVTAPLKENLAAAMLMRAHWPEIARAGGPLVDPLCGSGTLPIEAAMMAADIAPGIKRSYFGFLGWKGHQEKTWNTLMREAHDRREQGLQKLPPIVGFDADRKAVRAALANVVRAGLTGTVHIERRNLAQACPPAKSDYGLVVANPPYGERLGDVKNLQPLYKCLGDVLLEKFIGWKAAVLTGNEKLAKAIPLRAVRVNTLYNGELLCMLLQFTVDPSRIFKNIHKRSPALRA